MICNYCNLDCESLPISSCEEIEHWSLYAEVLKNERDAALAKLDLKDEDRDKLDVSEWLLSYKKVLPYNCNACKRHYELPTHINHFTCVCGSECRLRHIGGSNPDQSVIDAAIAYFGNERSGKLAWIAEIVGGEHCLHYTADDIRSMIRQEMNKWQSTNSGWVKKKITNKGDA
jgi:hypothetical protein